jgi:hypothetical protein
MTTRTSRELNARIERLEAAAASAGCALICPHQSSEELHRALIGDYLRGHAHKQTAAFIIVLALIAAAFILF